MVNNYITRQEIAEDLGLDVALISKAIGEKVLVVDDHMGMVPRAWYKGAKITPSKIYDGLLKAERRSTMTWATGIYLVALVPVIGLALS